MFRSWGRVGTKIGGNKLEKFYDKNSAMDNFRSMYEEKTGNCWTSSSFTKYPNKFYPLEIDYGQVRTACVPSHSRFGTFFCVYVSPPVSFFCHDFGTFDEV